MDTARRPMAGGSSIPGIPGAPFDNIVIQRLKALERADRQMKDEVKATLEQL